MSIWTWIIFGGIAFLLVSSLSNNMPDFKLPNIPFINPSNSTSADQNKTSTPLPGPIQKGVDILEKSYDMPLWLLVLIGLGLVWIAKR